MIDIVYVQYMSHGLDGSLSCVDTNSTNIVWSIVFHVRHLITPLS